MSQSIPLYVQLKDQLRAFIFGGILAPGQKLPGIRQIADYISLNRHTVYRAIHELEAEGLIVTQQGKGTYVAENLRPFSKRNNRYFKEIARRAIRESKSLGYTPEELSEEILKDSRTAISSGIENHCIGFVECNKISLEHYATELQEELRLEIVPRLISELYQLRETGEDPFDNCELVVTTLGHMPEVRRILGEDIKIFPVTVGPYLEVFIRVLDLPRDSLVGIVTVSQIGSAGMKQAMVQAGLSPDRLILANTERPDLIREAIQRVDAMVVSFAAMDIVKSLLENQSIPIIEYHNVLDKTGLEALKQVLEDSTVNRSRQPTDRMVDPLDFQRALIENGSNS